ncbi:MAG: PrsW family intramembrane metalloprotease [Patescibacteria group bacterium]
MIVFAVILGIFPSLVWLVFFSREDIHPEPKKAIVKVFIFGALSAFGAIVFQYIFNVNLPFLKISEYSILTFFIFALIEELFKFLAAYYVMRKSRFFDEPIDAMIYMVTAGLGFAMAENILVGLNGILSQNMDGRQVLAVIVLRFMGATLLHALSSAIIGYYWAKSLRCKMDNFTCQASHISHNLMIGIIIAALLHEFFNYLIINYNNVMIIFPTIFLIIMAMFVFWDFEKIKIKEPY